MPHSYRQATPSILPATIALLATACVAGAQAAGTEVENNTAGNPVRLTASPDLNVKPVNSANAGEAPTQGFFSSPTKPTKPVLSEFESYVTGLAGTEIRRLGSELMLPSRSDAAMEANRQVPLDYLVGIGDEVQLTLWGSVDADLRLTVDRSGRIVIPRVGPVVVAGVRHAELNDLLTRRVSQVFKNFQLSATLGRLRSIAYSVSSLATVMTGLTQAGGPAVGGSFRNIELRRNGQVVSRFDLYDLLFRGDKKADLPLQADDVLHIGPLGMQVALIGSVNRPAITELRGNETVAEVLTIERLSDRNGRRVVELSLPQDGGQRLTNGDVLRAFNGTSAVLAQGKQFKRVRLEGEVARPGDYVLPPASTLADAVQAAGGLTPQAYLFGIEFSRDSVRRVQEEQYARPRDRLHPCNFDAEDHQF
jgi:protein involved in polysaccharide export with SLBB domain